MQRFDCNLQEKKVIIENSSLYYSDNFDGGGGLPLPNSGSNNYQFTSLDNMIGPKPVKQKKPTSLGLYDILGNVINYCGDVEDIDGGASEIMGSGDGSGDGGGGDPFKFT